ncbi:hypothetical protein QJQ45_014040, partial [Haematococcus lacustris]
MQFACTYASAFPSFHRLAESAMSRLLYQKQLLAGSSAAAVKPRHGVDATKPGSGDGLACRARLEPCPDGLCLALITPDRTGICVVPFLGTDPVRRFSSTVLTQRRKHHYGPDHFTALGWSGDGRRLLAAGAAGALYLLDQQLVLKGMWQPCEQQLPWARPGAAPITGVALPMPDTALLLTADCCCWAVPLKLGVEQWQRLRPMRLQGLHGDVRCVAYHHPSNSLVVAGLGGTSRSCPGVSLSLWKCQANASLIP